MTVSDNDLAIQRTKLANQRTYLAYMRTGFAIAAIASIYKQKYIVFFGIIMILMSSLQYHLINYNLYKGNDTSNLIFDIFPIFYIILSCGALYLQYNNRKKK